MCESYDKTCTKCGVTYPRSQFYKKAGSRDGLRPWCKHCCTAWARADRERDPEKHRSYWRQERETHRERANARTQRYRERNRELVRERDRVQYHEVRKHSPEYCARRAQKCREWLKNNPLRARELHVRHKHKIAHLPRVDYDAILLRDGYICHICGAAVAPADLSFDHVIPFCLGGSHTEDNIKVSHLRCNAAKGKKLLNPVTKDPPV